MAQSVQFTRRLVRFILLLAMLTLSVPLSSQSDSIWVLVDTGTMTLSIMEGGEVKRVYENIAVGRGGTAADKRKNDAITPLGEFRIVRITQDTPFHRFFGLDYPTLGQAQRAVAAGIIDEAQYMSIWRAHRQGTAPPQNTPLGGYLGIHGIGAGDPRIHEEFNWTNGCIATSNEQVDDMARWIHIGTRVVVR